MAHLNAGQMKIMASKELITGTDIPGTGKLSFCEACAEGKAHRAPFKPVGEIKSTRRLELVHSDVAGPMKTESFGGAKYFVTFIDDYSRCVTVYPMKYKFEVLEKFKKCEAAVTNQAECMIKTLRTDNGEYTSTEFQDFLKEKGIRHETTVPHSPQQNGVAERMN
jgi:transposase InsO family protein